MRAVVGAVNLDQGLQEAWNTIVGVVPLIVVFGAVMVAGFAIAALASAGTVRLLRRTGFDRAVERGGVGRALAQSRFDATDLLGRVVFYGLLLFALQLAFGVFGDNPVSDLLASVVAYLPKVFVAVVIMVVAAAIAAGVRDVVASALRGASYGGALSTSAGVAIITVGAFAALDQLEIAPAIVLGLFYALLAVVVGSAIVAIGGAGIQPMRAQWERALRRMEDEAPRVREGVQQARAAQEERRVDLVEEEARAERARSEQLRSEQIDQPGEGATAQEEQARMVPDATPTYIPASSSSDPTEEFRRPPPTADT